MKKKEKKDKKKPVSEQAAPADDAAPSVSYAATPAQHAAFFDSLIDLVPRKYYLEPDEPLLNLKHMKKAEKQAAKRQLKASLPLCDLELKNIDLARP